MERHNEQPVERTAPMGASVGEGNHEVTDWRELPDRAFERFIIRVGEE